MERCEECKRIFEITDKKFECNNKIICEICFRKKLNKQVFEKVEDVNLDDDSSENLEKLPDYLFDEEN